MKPVRDSQVKRFLMETMQLPDYKADICVAFARGNIGKAKMLASSEDFDRVNLTAPAPQYLQIVPSINLRLGENIQ